MGYEVGLAESALRAAQVTRCTLAPLLPAAREKRGGGLAGIEVGVSAPGEVTRLSRNRWSMQLTPTAERLPPTSPFQGGALLFESPKNVRNPRKYQTLPASQAKI